MEALINSILVTRVLPFPLSTLPPQVSDGLRAHFRSLPAPPCPRCHALCTHFRYLNNTTSSLQLQPTFQCRSCSRTFIHGGHVRLQHPYKPRVAARLKRKAPAALAPSPQHYYDLLYPPHHLPRRPKVHEHEDDSSYTARHHHGKAPLLHYPNQDDRTRLFHGAPNHADQRRGPAPFLTRADHHHHKPLPYYDQYPLPPPSSYTSLPHGADGASCSYSPPLGWSTGRELHEFPERFQLPIALGAEEAVIGQLQYNPALPTGRAQDQAVIIEEELPFWAADHEVVIAEELPYFPATAIGAEDRVIIQQELEFATPGAKDHEVIAEELQYLPVARAKGVELEPVHDDLQPHNSSTLLTPGVLDMVNGILKCLLPKDAASTLTSTPGLDMKVSTLDKQLSTLDKQLAGQDHVGCYRFAGFDEEDDDETMDHFPNAWEQTTKDTLQVAIS